MRTAHRTHCRRERNSAGGLRLADRGLMPASVLRVGRTLALPRDRYGSTDGRTARDIGPGGNQPENHAADLREDTHPAPDLLPPRKSQAQDAT